MKANILQRFFTFIHAWFMAPVIAKFALYISLMASVPFAQAAQCSFAIPDNWNNGFKTEITIENDSDQNLDDWSIELTWNQGVSLQNGWNGHFNCDDVGCTITSQGHTVHANQSFELGFVANKNGLADEVAISLSGDVCTNTGQTPPDDVTETGLWELDSTESLLNYVSVKKDHVAELNQFITQTNSTPALSGSIDTEGSVKLAVDLNSISTSVDIRDSRILDLLFETGLLPIAYFSTQIDKTLLSAMVIGDPIVQSITGQVSLHGVNQEVSLDVLVVKLASGRINVSTLTPMIIDSKTFDMAYGIEALRVVANLSSIGEAVPVYFNLTFLSAEQASFQPVTMAAKPVAPTELSASIISTDSKAQLNWHDNSNNETNYLVRFKSVDDRWQTAAELASNSRFYESGLPESGEFDYKVIALNNSVPSEPSNIERVVVTQTDPTARGMQLYKTNCAGCHGSEAGGLGSFPALDTERDVQAMIDIITTTMPYGTPSACDEQCASDIAAYIQTLWPAPLVCEPTLTPIAYGARQLKILTQTEYQNTMEDLLGVDFVVSDGLSPDSQVGFFINNTHASVQPSNYSNYLLVAEEVSQWVADNNFSPALSCSVIDEDCANSLVDELAPKVFRRPLTQDELQNYRLVATGFFHNGDIEAGMKLALEGLLSSPQFIYRHELGEPNPDNSELSFDAFELTSWEMATFLSYTFTGSTPDPQLWQAAERDELRDEANIIAHASRLAGNAKSVLEDFVGSWLGTGSLEVATKDQNFYPGFAELVPAMKAEMNETFSYIMTEPDESFSSLYTANFTFVNQLLANHYNLIGVTGDELQKVDTTQRGGILANGAFMSRWAEVGESHPIFRSVRVRRRMLCQNQPDPPAGIFEAREQRLAELSDMLQDPTTTNRLKYHSLTEGQPCSNCHEKYINPMGFGMEDFDAVGKIRSNDINGNMVDASGTLYAPEKYAQISDSVAFYGTKQLGAVIAGLSSAQSCLPQQMFRYVMGVGHDSIDPSNEEDKSLSETEKIGYMCEIDTLTNAMMQNSPRAMLEKFGSLKSVRYRKAWSRN
jgi:mono/diheme cytochrome c family protein